MTVFPKLTILLCEKKTIINVQKNININKVGIQLKHNNGK